MIVNKQKAIVHVDDIEFRNELNKYLNDGWEIVPETIVATIALAVNEVTNQLFREERYIAVVQKEVTVN